jgi:hypothetical protein
MQILKVELIYIDRTGQSRTSLRENIEKINLYYEMI